MNKKFLALIFAILSLVTSAPAFAAQYDIKEMTPEIQNAFSGRQNRYSQLQSLKASGILGENNQGLVKVLKPIPEAESVASAENSDRMTIYRAIATQNNLGGGGLAQIQKVFAEVQRDKAGAGDSIQLPSGEWVQK